jgi:parvulin-like peptidyl-prolyl isomerase
MKISKPSLYFFLVSLCLGGIMLMSCQKAAPGKIIAKVNNDVITEAEFIKALPRGFASDSIEKAYRHRLIDQLINKKLFIQEAKNLGLDKEIENGLEHDQQTILIQALYDDVVTKNVKINKSEINKAVKEMANEVHIKLISVQNEITAKMASDEIKKGALFDSVAVKYSEDPSSQNGGDIGFVPILYLEEPIRKAIMTMKPGQVSELIRGDKDFKLINFLEKRTSSSSKQELQDNAQKLLEQQKSQKLAYAYLEKMNKRLVYNPAGLAVFYKSYDSITPDEGEIWVVKKDSKKIVKAKNLLHVAREFPVSLDTAMRTYSIKRAIEDDVLYEDALTRKLDKKADIAAELESRKNDLLYEKFFLNEITQKINITDKDIADYYNAHKVQFGKSKLSDATPMIRNTIMSDQRQALYQTVVDALKSNAKIEINEKLLMTAGKTKMQKNNKTGGK